VSGDEAVFVRVAVRDVVDSVPRVDGSILTSVLAFIFTLFVRSIKGLAMRPMATNRKTTTAIGRIITIGEIVVSGGGGADGGDGGTLTGVLMMAGCRVK
jgi:hypothetical protein